MINKDILAALLSGLFKLMNHIGEVTTWQLPRETSPRLKSHRINA